MPIRVTRENCERLAELTSEETSVPIAVTRMFFQMVIGKKFTDDELHKYINMFISNLAEAIDRQWTEMSIDDDGTIFYYNKDNPDDTFYPSYRLDEE